MSDQDPNDLTKLERLAVLLREVAVEPEAMDPQQIAKYLQDHKVDLTAPGKRLEAILKKTRAQQRLERARERRLKAVENAKTLLSLGAGAVEAARTRVLGMIQQLEKRDPEQAHVYAREFEKATPEDLATLQEDLILLEMETNEDAKGNPQDPR